MATELGKAYVQIVPSARGISGSIQSALGGEADAAGKSAGGKLVSTMKKVIAAAGIGKLLSDTIKEGARYEQARGGIETLFGAKGAKSVQEYAQMVNKSVSEVQGEYTRLKSVETQMMNNANKAWKTAGISANDYMEQSTSFAASLLQSVGGSQEKAAAAAHQAVIDMSDNANKFGTNIGDIQHAYQGFAKQNYTMLDNLKLGYGGTKSEMERLLADAEEISGIHYDIENLDDVYKAIHVIQEELGVTGTTAQEASTTLSGSFASMKAAASNFMAQLVVGEDVKGAMTDLVESAVTVAGNLIPAIGRVLGALPGAIGTAIKELHPQLLDGLKTATDAVKANLPGMIQNAMTGLLNFSSTIRQNAGQLIDAGLTLIKTIADGIIQNIPVFIQTVPTIISNLAGIINDNAPKVLSAGLSIIKNLAIGLIKAIPVLIANIPKIIKAIWDVFKAFNWLKIGKTMITGIVGGIKTFINNIPVIFHDLVNVKIRGVFEKGWNAIINVVKAAANGIKTVITTVFNAIKTVITTILSAYVAMVRAQWNAIRTVISTVVNAVKTVITTVFNAIKAFISQVVSGWKNIITTTWNGIKTAVTTVVNAIKTTISNVFNAVKTVIQTIFNSIRSIASTIWNGIKTAISTPINAAKNAVSTAVGGIKSVINGLKTVAGVVKNAFSSVKDAIASPFQKARELVSNAVGKIKGIFPISMGKIFSGVKLPHFNISGGKVPWGIGGQGTKPSVSISWYKRGGVFDEASVIGVGEAGREIVTPDELMRRIVREETSGTDQKTYSLLVEILRTLMIIVEQDKSIVMNNREFARLVNEVVYG